jgi:ActR/RegA family two-component response regulator
MPVQPQLRRIVFDDADDVFSRGLGEAFRDRGLDVRAFVEWLSRARRYTKSSVAAVIADLRIADDSGLVVVEAAKALRGGPVILILNA